MPELQLEPSQVKLSRATGQSLRLDPVRAMSLSCPCYVLVFAFLTLSSPLL